MLGLSILDKIKPAKYKYKDSKDLNLPCSHLSGKFYYGMIAQDIAKEFPLEEHPFLTVDPDSGFYKVAYDQFIPVLIKGVQELSEKVNGLERKIEELSQSRS